MQDFITYLNEVLRVVGNDTVDLIILKIPSYKKY